MPRRHQHQCMDDGGGFLVSIEAAPSAGEFVPSGDPTNAYRRRGCGPSNPRPRSVQSAPSVAGGPQSRGFTQVSDLIDPPLPPVPTPAAWPFKSAAGCRVNSAHKLPSVPGFNSTCPPKISRSTSRACSFWCGLPCSPCENVLRHSAAALGSTLMIRADARCAG